MRRDRLEKKPFDVNLRTVHAVREIGKRYKSLSTVATLMNMPTSTNDKQNIQYNKLCPTSAYTSIAQESMKKAGKEVPYILEQGNEIKNCQASFDGTWQKRGYSSLDGVVTGLSCKTGKCLNFHHHHFEMYLMINHMGKNRVMFLTSWPLSRGLFYHRLALFSLYVIVFVKSESQFYVSTSSLSGSVFPAR